MATTAVWTDYEHVQVWTAAWGVSKEAAVWALSQAFHWRYGKRGNLGPVAYEWRRGEGDFYRVRRSHLAQLEGAAKARFGAEVLERAAPP